MSLRENYTETLITDSKHYKNGFFLTLNTLTMDNIKFECQLTKLTHWLNKFCYGRSYRKNKKRLKIFGTIENGKINSGLHIHLLVMHNEDINRSFEDINFFIRKKWYRLIQAGGTVFGNLVNLQLVNEIRTRIAYILKTCTTQDSFSSLRYF